MKHESIQEVERLRKELGGLNGNPASYQELLEQTRLTLQDIQEAELNARKRYKQLETYYGSFDRNLYPAEKDKVHNAKLAWSNLVTKVVHYNNLLNKIEDTISYIEAAEFLKLDTRLVSNGKPE